MAEDKSRNQKGGSEDRDETNGFGTADSGDSDFGALTGDSGGGLGNLPPLSDFESSSGGGFDSGLPPLSSIDSDSDKGKPSSGGLPPISDIPVETPIPTGGAVKPRPTGYGSTPVFGTPTSDSGLDTPSGSGFQDLSADSDFTPETPEVAPPGPESDIDTPLFDSAFGGSGSFSAAADTSAPTQAMETPMFGADQGGGFDADAFGGGARTTGGGFRQGTPVPDFGPDTGAPTAMTPPPAAPVRAGGGGGGKGGLMLVVGVIVGALVGVFVGPRVPGVNPYLSQVNDQKGQIEQLQRENTSLKAAKNVDVNLTPEAVKELADKQAQIQGEIDKLTQEKDTAQQAYTSVQGELDKAKADLDQANSQFVEAQNNLDRAQNEMAVTEARHAGLKAENQRLEALTGKLEEANTRRMMTKETLESNIQQLAIQIRESSPLTPEKYSRDGRITAVEDLEQQAKAANWVDPKLLDAYTNLYLKELQISQATDYFFAKLPVVDRFGTQTMSWAECVMNGNWGVYYRTLDGKHVGVYKNVSSDSTPKYTFVDVKDEAGAKDLESQIFAARTPGYEEKLELLAKKQLVVDDRTPLQRDFESL